MLEDEQPHSFLSNDDQIGFISLASEDSDQSAQSPQFQYGIISNKVIMLAKGMNQSRIKPEGLRSTIWQGYPCNAKPGRHQRQKQPARKTELSLLPQT